MNLPSAPTSSPSPTASNPLAALRAPTNSNPLHPPRIRRRGLTIVLLLAAVLPMLALGTLWLIHTGRQPTGMNLETWPVRSEQLVRALVARGEVQSAECSELICHVRSLLRNSNYSTSIKWVIEDGSWVKRGQRLVELDDSALEEEQHARKLLLEQAQADWIQAQENYKIIDSQNQSDLQSAAVAIQLAAIDLQKYVQGDYEQLRKDLQGRLSLAESDLDMCRERTAFSKLMVKKGFLNANQARADALRLDNAHFALDQVQEELRVLQKYTHRRNVTDLQNKLKEARSSLERIQRQAKAKEIQAQIDRLSKQRIYQLRLTHYQELEDQIKKCVLSAPQDGLVVYNVPDPSRSNQQPTIAQGEPVREGQLLLRLADLTKLQVHVCIHEALVARLHGDVWQPTGFGDGVQAALLVTPEPATRLLSQLAFQELRERFRERDRRLVASGQPALIRIDALPERVFRGHVKQVASLATQQDGWSDVKGYHTLIAFDDPVEGLNPDLSAEVTLLDNEEPGPVLTVPVQALFGSPGRGKQRTCFVLTEQGPEERALLVGQHNDQLAEVVSGLEEGEEVILNPRALLSKKGKANLPN